MSPSRNIVVLVVSLLLVCLVLGIGGLILTFSINASPRATPPPLVFPTRPPTSDAPLPVSQTEVPTLPVSDEPQGKIVYVCQMFRNVTTDQLCIINADGTGQRRITTDDEARHFYPSFSPDGQSVLFSSDMGRDGYFQLFEQNLATGELTPFGQTGIAPEVSPDNQYIAFTQGNGKNDTVWVMERDGQNPRMVYDYGWDPTWSPDGQSLLFATLINNETQLATIRLDGSGFRQVTRLPLLRGRSDWSADGQYMITYSGNSWQRELFLFSPDGSNPRQITPAGGNSQGPSFSPDSQWVAFTSYFDLYRNVNGCEIYIMRVDGSDLRRLTDNNYCDWQPRWGP